MNDTPDTPLSADENDAARHNNKMAKKKAARDKIMASKTDEKGLVIVHTGKGKGKTTAAFGMIFRALGNNMNVAVVQFVKGQWLSGERAALEKFQDQDFFKIFLKTFSRFFFKMFAK